MTGDDRLFALAEAVCDRQPIDLDSVLAATPPADRRALSLLAAISEQLWTPEPDDEPAPLSRWGRFELRAQLGRGAFGEVYRAWDPHFEREVAVKLRHANLDSEATHGLLLAEGRLLAKIDHPGVARVYELGEHDGRFGLVMERVEGETLAAAIARRGPFPASEVAAFGVELAGALAALHDANIVHRDLKAQNVILRPDGRLVLVDFGIGLDLSKPTDEELVVSGTPLYMAPELFEGARPTPASDLYSLGVLLFHLATGEFPIEAETVADLRLAHVRVTSLDVRRRLWKVPKGLVRVIVWCLEGQTQERPREVQRVGAALRPWMRRRWPAKHVREGLLSLLLMLLLVLSRPGPLLIIATRLASFEGATRRVWQVQPELVDRQRLLNNAALKDMVLGASKEYQDDPSPENAWNLAVRLSQSGRFLEALHLCDEVRAGSAGGSHLDNIYLPRGIALLGLGRTREVREELMETAREFPSNSRPARVWLFASALSLEGNTHEAFHSLKNLVRGRASTNFDHRARLLALSIALHFGDRSEAGRLLAEIRELQDWSFLADLRSAARLVTQAGDREALIELAAKVNKIETEYRLLFRVTPFSENRGLLGATSLELAALLASIDGEHESAFELLDAAEDHWWNDHEMLLARLLLSDRAGNRDLSCQLLAHHVQARKADFLWTGIPFEWKLLADRLESECRPTPLTSPRPPP